MHSVNDILRHGKFGGMCPVDEVSGGQAEEIEVPLSVASRSHGEGSNGVGCHSVIMLFVGLYVLPIFIAAVSVVIDSLSSDDGMRAQGLRDAVLVRGRV